MEPVRLGVIGVGDIDGLHTLGFDALDDCEVVAIADLDQARMAELLAEIPMRQIATYTDYRQLLARDNVEAVVIAAPQYVHREMALAAFVAGKDVFLEKPIAPTVQEADAIIAAAEESGLILQVGLVYRYAELYRTMARMCNDGSLGQVKFAWCKELRQNFPPRPWYYHQQQSGGALMDKDCHHFDLFNWFIGSPPVKVFAMGGQHVIRQGHPHTVECSYSFYEPITVSDSTIVDHAFVVVEYENGARASLALCMYLKVPYEGLEVGVLSTQGHELIARDDRTLTLWGGPTHEWAREIPIQELEGPRAGHIGAYRERLEFIACVRTRQPPFADASVGRASMVVPQAAELSIKEERVVYVEEIG